MKTKLDLLNLPVWTYKEIMQFDNNIKSKATAIKVKNRAIKEQNGVVKYGTKYVKTDSVLALYGTTREEELNILERCISLNEKLQS